jgi:DNA-binding MurR/RpiR family transcriptional regulator
VTIRDARPRLRQSEQAVADYVLEQPGEVIGSSVTALAQASGTSEATVLRFCRALGYRGFPELKLVLARDLARDTGEARDDGAAFTPQDTVSHIAFTVFERLGRSLQDTMELQQVSQLEAAVAALATADSVLFAGGEGRAWLAHELERRFQLIGIRCTGHGDREAQFAALSSLRSGDALVLLAGATDDAALLRLASVGAERGLATIAVASRFGGRLDHAVGVALHATTPVLGVPGGVFEALVPEVALLDALFAAVAVRRGPATAEAFELLASARGQSPAGPRH